MAPHLTVKKAVERSEEILVSVSSRTISGSFKPALANSCRAEGMVAENSSVCGQQHKHSVRCHTLHPAAVLIDRF